MMRRRMNGRVWMTMPIARPKLKSHIFALLQNRRDFIERQGRTAQGLESPKPDGAGSERRNGELPMSVVPYLTIPGGRAGEAAEFYAKLFGAKETMRMPAEDKKRLMHCALEFAGNFIYLADDFRNQAGKPQ